LRDEKDKEAAICNCKRKNWLWQAFCVSSLTSLDKSEPNDSVSCSRWPIVVDGESLSATSIKVPHNQWNFKMSLSGDFEGYTKVLSGTEFGRLMPQRLNINVQALLLGLHSITDG
jgi:hypothetical protein